MKRKTSYVLIGAAVVVVIVVAVAALNHRRTADRVALDTLRAYERNDANALWALTPPAERRVYGLTKGKLRALMDYAGFNKAYVQNGKYLIFKNPRDGSASASRWYVEDGKRPALLGTSAEMREKRAIVAQQPVTHLIYIVIANRGRRILTEPKLLSGLAGVKSVAGQLTQLGFLGVADTDCTRLIPWDELQARYEQKLAKYRAIHGNGK